MKPEELNLASTESLLDTFDSVITNQRWQVEYMRNALIHLSEGKRIVQLLMEHYLEGKKKTRLARRCG